ncbi:MAG: hypothetical protein ACXWLR_08605, partial [Myxococcales bacterium]
MRATCLLLCASLLACQTSTLGTCAADADCSSNAICDLSLRACVQTDAPQISNVSVTTSPGYTAPDGGLFFDTAGAPLAVSATITSRSGAAVDPATACLRITGETGACAHPGSAGTGSTFTFPLPRPAGPADGTALGFTISAASASGHSSSSAVQQVYFDDQPPGISIVDDPAAYARTLPDGGAAMINVSATITDGAGVVSPQLLSGAKTLPPSSGSSNVYVFQLDPRDAPAGAEGSYGFQVAAQDNLGHVRQVSGSRKIDDAPPAIAVQIYKDVPDGGGVTYPAAVPNTGWTGATFVYTDTVHVSGTITDLSGVGSATLRVDGIELDGGVAAGASRSLGCTPGTTSCPFSLDVTLNDAGVPFHTGASTFDVGGGVLAPAGDLRFTIDAQDKAAAFDGTQSPKAASGTTPARATRLLWQSTLSGAAVSGLAVHPDGDLIVTMDGGTGSTVYSLAPDQAATHWGVTLNASLSADGVIGTPAIGAGDATSARIYVAGSNGDFYAINPNGSSAWKNPTTSTNFTVSPAVTQVTIASNTVDQIVLPDGIASPNSKLWRATSAIDATSVATSNRDFHAAPLILNGVVFFATQTGGGGTSRLTKHTIGVDGTLGAVSVDSANPGIPYFGLITDGTNLYAATRPATGAGLLLKIDTAFTRPIVSPFWSDALTAGLAGEPTIGIDGMLYAGDLATTATLQQFNATTGAASTFVTPLGSVGMTPLQGSDGHVYVPRRIGALSAYDANQLSWSLDTPGTILRYATMDCQGRLFAASGATVYAFISDDRGLADTPWPSLRRDARNTGNASTNFLKYGIRTV